MPIEAHNSIGKIKRYHTPLQQVYKIIYDKFRDTSAKISLQIAIKAVNDSAGPNRIIPILLVFSAYPRITENSVLLLIITKKTETIRKTTKEVRYFYARQQVTDTLAIRNSPNIITTLKFPI
jgi:hypothetical protein